MIKHIVFFNLKDQAEGASKEENAQKINEVLSALPVKINEIKLYEFGINFADSPSAMDYCLISGFDSAEDLNNYRKHPAHVEALEFIKKVISESLVVDFEI